jgi:hypothetical protein
MADPRAHLKPVTPTLMHTSICDLRFAICDFRFPLSAFLFPFRFRFPLSAFTFPLLLVIGICGCSVQRRINLERNICLAREIIGTRSTEMGRHQTSFRWHWTAKIIST